MELSWNKLGKGISNAVSGIGENVTNIADPGNLIHDSETGERAQSAWNEGANAADAQLTSDLQPYQDELSAAKSNGRDMNTLLNNYDSGITGIRNSESATDVQNQAQANNAMSAGNIQSFMNPYVNSQMKNASQAVAGGAGSALQSSATNQDMYNAAANTYGNAYKQATTDANQNLENQTSANRFSMNNNQQQGTQLNNQLNWDISPEQQWLDLGTDTATQRYNQKMTGANVNAQVAGQSRSLL